MMSKDARFTFRLSEAEKAMIEQAAAKEGLKASTWLHQQILKRARQILGLV
jgi:uncharacterized protein (DUF1778 family)